MKSRSVLPEPKASLTCSSPETVAQAALLGLGPGIGESGTYHALPYLRSGQLKVVQHKSYQAPRVRAVASYMLECLKPTRNCSTG